MDNAAYHKVQKVESMYAIRGLMCLTLPPYSPEWNPIERYFRLFKTHLSSILNPHKALADNIIRAIFNLKKEQCKSMVLRCLLKEFGVC